MFSSTLVRAPGGLPRPSVRTVVVVVATAAFVWLQWYAFSEGFRLQRDNRAVKLGAGPLVGAWDLRLSPMVAPAIVVAAASVIALPRLVRTLSVRSALGVTAFAAAAFAVALAASDGWSTLIAPVIHPTEYWAGLPRGGSASEYLSTFLDRQQSYSVHVRGHPPGFPLLLQLLRSVGLGSAWWAAALSFIGVAMSVGAVGWTVHRLAGDEPFRRALPFLALAPYAVWQGTSADAFFAGTAAVAIALLVLAMTTPTTWVARTSAVVGGLVAGACCLLTFGAPTLAPLVMALTWRSRRISWLPWALAGVAAMIGGFAAAGYWWVDGLTNTRMFYEEGTAQFRPGWYFFFANLAVLAIAIGPAAVAGLSRRQGVTSGVGAIVVGAAACVLLADASGLSKAETERIWLLYMPWIAVAAAAVGTTIVRQRWWLGGQALAALVLQVTLVSKW